jgi:hypothetical protein
MKLIIRSFLMVSVFFAASCSITDLDGQLENPNEVGISNLDVNLLMNKVQLDFADFFNNSSVPGMELTRVLALTSGSDAYSNAYTPSSFNAVWDRAYQRVLVQAQTLIDATEGTGRTVHNGAAKVMKAYVLMTLVDQFGDVPNSEALKGYDGIFNPKADPGSAVYTDAIRLLDEAIVTLGQTPQLGLTRDIFFAGAKAKWAALANTLKLKAYLNTRLIDQAGSKAAIEALLTADLIDTDGEEFTYKYGTADLPARSRHPLYREMYQTQAGSANTYINNYFMQQLYSSKGVQDPRWRFYLYRQVGSLTKALSTDPDAIPCLVAPRPSHYPSTMAWCAFEPGFFGRDHGNSDGAPPDTKAKTCHGIYPVGGLSDTNDGVADFEVVTVQGQGANGAGIQPIWMACFTDFLKAEAALTLGTTGDAKALMMSGVTKSINRVRKFAADNGQGIPATLEPSQVDYEAAVGALYDAAGSNDDKLSVIGKEAWLAFYGNGVESYNLYRRTGKPAGIQPMRPAVPGLFVRTFLYPADYANLNENAVAKDPSKANKTFWDNNPDDFVK